MCHVVVVGTTSRMVAHTLPLSKRESHAPPGCHRPPNREPLPPVSFRHDNQEHGTLRCKVTLGGFRCFSRPPVEDMAPRKKTPGNRSSVTWGEVYESPDKRGSLGGVQQFAQQTGLSLARATLS